MEDTLTRALPPYYSSTGLYPIPHTFLPQFTNAVNTFILNDFHHHSSSANTTRLRAALDNLLLTIYGRGGLTIYVSCATPYKKTLCPFAFITTNTATLLPLLSPTLPHNLFHTLPHLTTRIPVPILDSSLPPITKALLSDPTALLALTLLPTTTNPSTPCTYFFKSLYGYHAASLSDSAPQSNEVGFTQPPIVGMIEGTMGYGELLKAFHHKTANPSAPPLPTTGKETPALQLTPVEYHMYKFIEVAIHGWAAMRTTALSSSITAGPGGASSPSAGKGSGGVVEFPSYLTLFSQYLSHFLSTRTSRPSIYIPLLLEMLFNQVPLAPACDLSRAVLVTRLNAHRMTNPNQPVGHHPPIPRVVETAGYGNVAMDPGCFPHGLYADCVVMAVTHFSGRGYSGEVVWESQATLYPWIMFGVATGSAYVAELERATSGRWVPPVAPAGECALITYLNVWGRIVAPWRYDVPGGSVGNKGGGGISPSKWEGIRNRLGSGGEVATKLLGASDPARGYSKESGEKFIAAHYHFYVDVFLTLVERIESHPSCFEEPAVLEAVNEVFRIIVSVAGVLEGCVGSPEYERHAAALGGWRPVVDYTIGGAGGELERIGVIFAGQSLRKRKEGGGAFGSGIGGKVMGLFGEEKEEVQTACEQKWTFAASNATKKMSAGEYATSIVESIADILAVDKALFRKGCEEKARRLMDVAKPGEAVKNTDEMGFLSDAGRKRVVEGELKFSAANVCFVGGEWDRPIGTYEIKALVWLTKKASTAINDFLAGGAKAEEDDVMIVARRGEEEEEEEENVAMKVAVRRARKMKAEKREVVKLRFLADARNLVVVMLGVLVARTMLWWVLF